MFGIFDRFIKSFVSFTPPEAITGKGDNFAISLVSSKFGPDSIPSLFISVYMIDLIGSSLYEAIKSEADNFEASVQASAAKKPFTASTPKIIWFGKARHACSNISLFFIAILPRMTLSTPDLKIRSKVFKSHTPPPN